MHREHPTTGGGTAGGARTGAVPHVSAGERSARRLSRREAKTPQEESNAE
jgi:hypothetical protein